MFDNSVIRKTGQWWKLQVFFFGLLGGGVCMAVGVSLMSDHPEVAGALLGGGVLLVGISSVFGLRAIRCPDCGARWLHAG